jgi:hypothetical protein
MRGQIAAIALAGLVPLALVAGLAGCSTLKALATPDQIHAEATLAYIALANWVAGDEARPEAGPARFVADEAKKLQGWNALTVERAIRATHGAQAPTALDALADSLKPAGA